MSERLPEPAEDGVDVVALQEIGKEPCERRGALRSTPPLGLGGAQRLTLDPREHAEHRRSSTERVENFHHDEPRGDA
ncbi:MAG: hypothetical protein JNK04_04220 [Myxococcales bacterium]|nr:hypothetical protein [Myxococcales bacterium]